MCDLLSIDKEMIDKERERLKLPKPVDFADGDVEGRITPELIDKLMPLVLLPFDESAVDEGNKGTGFTAKGVHCSLQLARMQEIFGTSHISIEHEVVEEGKTENTYFCDVLVTLKIGNYTFYIDSVNNRPDSSFVSYYTVSGIGYEGRSNTKGGAKKNAIAYGLKECFRTMGMLRYLYLDEDSEEGPNSPNENKTQVKLLEIPIFTNNGTVYMRCKAKDIGQADEKEIDLIVYKTNKFNTEEHQKMIDLLNQYKHTLVINKELTISYKENNWNNQEQYIINKIFTKQIGNSFSY